MTILSWAIVVVVIFSVCILILIGGTIERYYWMQSENGQPYVVNGKPYKIVRLR